MMEKEFRKPAEDLAGNAADYINLKTDEVKLRTAKGLSITLNRLLLALLFFNIGSIAITALGFGAILLIGDLAGSYSAGAFIVAGAFLLILALLWALRNKLFLNGLVRLFIGIFFPDDQIEESDEIQ